MTAREYHLENALKWVRQVALLHYMGGAFEPEHMRDIANIAAKALNGRELPGYDQAMARASEHADELYASFRKHLDPDEDVREDEEDGDGHRRP